MKLAGCIDASEILRAGVYILIAKGVVIYIGKSKSMLGRVYTHRNLWQAKRRKQVPSWLPTPGIHFDEVHIRPCRMEDLDRLEAEMIALYKPRYNKRLKPVGVGVVPMTINGVSICLNAKPGFEAIERRL